MNEELIKKIEAQEEKIDAIYVSVEKTRKYFLFIIWASVITFVLPAIGLMFAIPAFIDNYLGSFKDLL